MHLALEGRTALVSGSHRGTGSIIARQLADEGARVLVLVNNFGRASPLADAIHGQNLRIDGGALEALT